MSKLLVMLCAAVLCAAAVPPLSAEQKVFKSGRWVPLAESADPDGGLQSIRDLIREGKYSKAYRTAQELVDSGPEDVTLWEARMLMGDISLLTDEMSDARMHYDAVLSAAPESSRIYQDTLRREFELAWQWIVGGRKKRLEVLGMRIPFVKVPAADDGLELLRELRGVRSPRDEDLPVKTLLLSAEHQLASAQYDLAEGAYGQMLDRYPNRNEAVTAKLQQAVCKLAQFRGSEYDLDGLRTVRKRLEDFSRDHSDESARRDLDVVMRRIDWTFARRDFETAEFYRRLGDIRPAIRYYRFILRQYPDSPWQERAKGRLSQLGADDFVESLGTK